MVGLLLGIFSMYPLDIKVALSIGIAQVLSIKLNKFLTLKD